MFENAIALTGSIATGKSTVCAFLKMYGYRIVDADALAHSILRNSTEDINKLFGEEYISNGEVDRKKLGSLIFSDRDSRLKLEAFMHPKIKIAIIEEAQKLEQFKSIYFVDIPLFYERGSYDIKRVLLVYATKEQQLARLIDRNSLSHQEALKRIEIQMDIERKREFATYIIDNSKDLKSLQSECDKFVEMLKKGI